ncbi:dimethylsulfoniopropionate demethylase [Ruegeria sp. SCSIO 43209]|uniref:dimethylsulfoniopropionate demethylase n=1 Tax=Ruegeria sp. SCSIO 43209 TaxID=2793010 RepID=UPI001CA99896|nr:dimethylsulfoniopropionate demethylase [Ruegeria sp. SCSIO 43209]UAB90452.1 dimethylsulfoniopropionate demethylase [Ruegeria sp. SCSIO 43209]
MAVISPNRRVRKTPFTPGVEAEGVKGYTVYNHMLLATVFESVEADAAHLKQHVQVWDVSCERQVQIKGPDALRLMKMLSPRDMDKMQANQCYYVPIVDHNGGMLNDPVAIKLADDHYWLSVADGDLWQFALGIVIALGLDVDISEPDVSPLAVQGPKADELMTRVFGDEVRDIKFFRYKRLAFEDTSFVVARSGWSKQGGFEIYVEGTDYGMPLWDTLFSNGRDLNVRAGCPNGIERVESGLLSFGSDMRRENTPYECGLARFCNSPLDYIGKAALADQAKNGPPRQIRSLVIEGEIGPCTESWPLMAGGRQVGQVASAAYSPEFGVNVAIGMVDRSHWAPGTRIELMTEHGMRWAEVQEKFWR